MLINCSKCKARVDAKVESYLHGYDENEPPYKVSLLQCPSCHSPLIGVQENYGSSDFGDEIWSEAGRVWPSPETYLSHSIPSTIRSSLEEAEKCLRTGAYTACVIMTGRALEAMCKHFATKSQYLAGGLKELLEREIIDKRLYEWSEELRKHRNLAAHATDDKFTHEDGEYAFDFATAICNYVFVLNEKFKAFMERKTIQSLL